MASREAHGEPLRRIRHALELWNVTGYVVWDDKPHIASFLAELDRSGHTTRGITKQIADYVLDGGKVKEQDNPPGHKYSTDVFYYIILPIGDRKVFIKFVIFDEEKDPYIQIVNIHSEIK